jgi:hypothetical protein
VLLLAGVLLGCHFPLPVRLHFCCGEVTEIFMFGCVVVLHVLLWFTAYVVYSVLSVLCLMLVSYKCIVGVRTDVCAA